MKEEKMERSPYLLDPEVMDLFKRMKDDSVESLSEELPKLVQAQVNQATKFLTKPQ